MDQIADRHIACNVSNVNLFPEPKGGGFNITNRGVPHNDSVMLMSSLLPVITVYRVGGHKGTAVKLVQKRWWG